MEKQRRIKVDPHPFYPFTTINSTSEHLKYFVSMLQYKLLNKGGEGTDEDFTGSSWCGQYKILCFGNVLKQLFG